MFAVKCESTLKMTKEGRKYTVYPDMDLVFKVGENFVSARVHTDADEMKVGEPYQVGLTFYTLQSKENFDQLAEHMQVGSVITCCEGRNIVGFAKIEQVSEL